MSKIYIPCPVSKLKRKFQFRYFSPWPFATPPRFKHFDSVFLNIQNVLTKKPPTTQGFKQKNHHRLSPTFLPPKSPKKNTIISKEYIFQRWPVYKRHISCQLGDNISPWYHLLREVYWNSYWHCQAPSKSKESKDINPRYEEHTTRPLSAERCCPLERMATYGPVGGGFDGSTWGVGFLSRDPETSETNSVCLPLKIGRAPIGKDRIPTINFQGLLLSVSGKVPLWRWRYKSHVIGFIIGS